MNVLEDLKSLRLPVIAAPMFIISNPKMVIAQCKAGIVGSFPALNARGDGVFEAWLIEITEELDRYNQANPDNPAAPFAVNQIVFKTNTRLHQDIELCAKYKVPVQITSLGAVAEVNDAAHSYGGIVFHDVINQKYAHKAIEKGADGLITVAAGAGGHAGPLALSGCIATGNSVLAAQAMGADFGYIGSAFIATEEANADQAYKQMVVDSDADDIVYSDYFSGVHGNYLKPSIEKAGLDPSALPDADPSNMLDFAEDKPDAKAWKDIWGCGQGIGAVEEITTVQARVDQMVAEYQTARQKLGLS